ncbi:MAG: septum formation inhibitor Maf [Bacteroidota bacterium]
MKRRINFRIGQVLTAFAIIVTLSCKDNNPNKGKEMALNSEMGDAPVKAPTKKLSPEFKDYWYAGEAEITSYNLSQPRYGQLREGKAVTIFVTEPFAAKTQVKADNHDASNIPVLKLNTTKNYLTGIYPYSIMTSAFYPLNGDTKAQKVTFSTQEWCGQVYAQVNNREQMEVMSHSYFETEGDQDFAMDHAILENELWNRIRVDPENLPLGKSMSVPALEYIRLSHKEFKAYAVDFSLDKNGGLSTYTITYPKLKRTLKITFGTTFPHTIEGWTETFVSGYGENAQEMTSTATKIATLKSPYWQQNSNEYISLRDSLGL